MVDTLFEFDDPLGPLVGALAKNKLVDDLTKRGYRGYVFEGEWFWDVLLLVVVLEGEGTQVEAGCRGEGHVYLVAEEGVRDVGSRVVVDESHYDAPDHLPDLMVDEALPNYIENEVILIEFVHLESMNVPLGLRVLCP